MYDDSLGDSSFAILEFSVLVCTGNQADLLVILGSMLLFSKQHHLQVHMNQHFIKKLIMVIADDFVLQVIIPCRWSMMVDDCVCHFGPNM